MTDDSKKQMCFVLMPFADQFKNQWEMAFKPAINEAGLMPYRGDAVSLGTNMIMKDVTRCIYESTIIIADLTGRNPNLMYELGLAHSAKKQVIILGQKESDIPFDLKHIRYLMYSAFDLQQLKMDLTERITNTLSQNVNHSENFFPELKLLTVAEIEELKYLRQNSSYLNVSVTPKGADIFFNGKLVGQGKARIKVNCQAEKNTLSFSAVQMFERHIDIVRDDIDQKSIKITLDPIEDELSDLNKRVPYFLRYLSRDPNNPVLMKAICIYLRKIGALDEAAIEAEELVSIAPNWNMALYTAGNVFSDLKEYDRGLNYYHRAISLNPKHAIAYIGLSCQYSVLKRGEEALKFLEKVANDKDLKVQLLEWGSWKCSTETDFEYLKISDKYSRKFNEIVQILEA